jgi:hypothetical protein
MNNPGYSHRDAEGTSGVKTPHPNVRGAHKLILKPLLTDEHLNTLTTKKDFHIPPFLPFGYGTAEPVPGGEKEF